MLFGQFAKAGKTLLQIKPGHRVSAIATTNNLTEEKTRFKQGYNDGGPFIVVTKDFIYLCSYVKLWIIIENIYINFIDLRVLIENRE